MAREPFIPVFEEDESTINQRMIDRVADTWRKEPGDFMHDAIVPSGIEIKTLEMQLDETLKNSFALYAEGVFMDYKLSEVGLERNEATPNKRRLEIEADAGVEIPAGYTISAVITDESGNPIEYETDVKTSFVSSGKLNVAITAVVPGAEGNLATGTQFILMPPIAGVRVVTDLGTTTYGTDTEEDESAYDRYAYKVQNPDTGGNKFDYVTWAMEVDGVGAAKCIPRWNGNGTVKVVIVDSQLLPDSGTLVSKVQAYLDPGSNGLGDGQAPIGARVSVVSATAKTINITASVTLLPGYTKTEVKESFEAAFMEYLRNMIFTEKPILYNQIGGQLIRTPGVENYTNLKVNGATADIPVGAEEVAVKGTITL
ncbi:baseplate J/gp47 family protein [Cytobacillus kochii]|uniref:baseplate J/gp47 family protein n=1 Tax=Cytobacillus kochii TaxID=859143 RepID=UPI00402A6F05